MWGASDDDIEKDAGDDDEGAKGYTEPGAGIRTGNHPQVAQNINIEQMNYSHQGQLNVTIKIPCPQNYGGPPCGPPYADSNDAALHTPTMAEDLCDLFETGDLERPVEEKFFVPVAKAFDEHCDNTPLARELRLEKAELSDLKTKYHNDVQELVYKMLVKWIQKYPEETVRTLVEALCKSRNEPPVRALKDYFDRHRN